MALIVGLGAAVLLTSQVAPTALEAVPGFEKSETRVDNSSRYRQALLSRALEPGVLNLWGNQQNEVTPYVSGSTATDNAYIILADTWGLIPTAALFFLALALLAIIARAYGRDATGLVAFPIAGLASLVALFVVAFITQQQVVIWMVLGALQGSPPNDSQWRAVSPAHSTQRWPRTHVVEVLAAIERRHRCDQANRTLSG